MSERSDVAMFDEVIEVFAQHHECSLPKDKVYGFTMERKPCGKL